MPRLEPAPNEPAALEAALRRQLRWIEDDVVIAVLGPDAAPAAAPQPAGADLGMDLPGMDVASADLESADLESADLAGMDPTALAAVPAHERGLLSRLRHGTTGILRRLFRAR